jgi:type IV secretory pathway VirB2 component (pilin)
MMIGASPASGGSGSTLLIMAHWLEGLIFSPATTTLAVLAVAATGLSMLSGRLPVRKGLTVALGCFILFGAPAIARGIIEGASGLAGAGSAEALPPSPIREPAFNPQPPPSVPPVADPYAGASVRN